MAAIAPPRLDPVGRRPDRLPDRRPAGRGNLCLVVAGLLCLTAGGVLSVGTVVAGPVAASPDRIEASAPGGQAAGSPTMGHQVPPEQQVAAGRAAADRAAAGRAASGQVAAGAVRAASDGNGDLPWVGVGVLAMGFVVGAVSMRPGRPAPPDRSSRRCWGEPARPRVN